MTNRDLFRYMLAVCGLWLLTYWKQILLALAIIVILFLLSGCIVGTLPTPQPTITPAATPWSTNTPTPTYTLTAVNISPTADVTPTQEVLCVPGSYITVSGEWALYDQSDMQRVAMVSYTSADGVFHFEQAVLQSGETALLLFDRTETAWRAIAAEGSPRLGWLSLDVLPVECQ